MTRINLLLRRSYHSIEQIIGFYSETFASRHFDISALHVLGRKWIAELGSAARRQCNHFVGKMMIAVGGISMAKCAQCFHHGGLCFRLSRIDYVVNLACAAKSRMI